MLIPQIEFSLPFLKKEQLTHNVYSFYFDRSTNDKFAFQAGQYMRVLLEFNEHDMRGRSRLLSISSSPHEKESLRFTLKIDADPSPFKKKLLSLEKGEEVNFWGPLGNFVLPSEKKSELVFISLGIGITPFRSILLSAKDYPSPITLLSFFRNKEDEVFYDELKSLESNNISINYLTTSIHGRLTEKIIKKQINKVEEPLYYISGPTNGVETIAEMLEEMGVAKEQLKKEQFTGY